jgi:hypothetical protein
MTKAVAQQANKPMLGATSGSAKRPMDMSTSHKTTSRRGRIVVVTMATALVVAGCVSQPSAVPTTAAPPTTPSTTGGTPSASFSATSSPQAPVSSRALANLLLPNENEGSTSAEVTKWTTDNTIGQQWLLDPCRPTAYPTDSKRTAFRTVSRTGPELRQARQAATFPTADTAAEVLAGFRRALTACKTGGNAAEGNAWKWVTEDIDVGDDGFVAASNIGGPNYSLSGNRIAVTRTGSLVFLAYDEGEYGTAEIDEGARLTQRVAERFAASK